MKTSYYDWLKKEVDDARFESEDLDKTVLYLPELFKTLCELLDENIVYEVNHRLINKALAYFVIPNDVIPEDVYGIAGYMDDLFVAATVLKRIYDAFPDQVNKHWYLEEDADKILGLCLFKSGMVLEENNLKDETLEFAGLEED
jgi:uncharacterized membrane protein YkvA (DUF1232 family)